MKACLKLTLTMFIVLSTSACKKEERNKGEYTIIGEVTGFPNGTKFYLRNLMTDDVFDSTTIENNRFKFNGSLASPPEQIWLNTTVDDKFIFTNLLIGNEKITITGDITDFPWNMKIKGSKTQDELNHLFERTKKFDNKRDSLIQIYRSLLPEKRQEIGGNILNEIEKLDSIMIPIRIDYIKSHPNTLISLIELGYLKNLMPRDTVQKIFEGYTKEIKKSKFAKVLEVFLKSQLLNIGDKYHDFEGQNQEGARVKFSEVKGHYTLLNFTAAGCGPCIQANNELLENKSTFSDSLTIVSFSHDINKANWLKSLKRNKISWSSIWDGKGSYSETSIKYGTLGTPTFVLINSEGIILDKWFGHKKGGILRRLANNGLIQD